MVDDETLVAAIRLDLASSRFKGEGHRKVHARLRRQGLIVGRQRVLALMKAAHLLSPHRRPVVPKREHDGKITTDGPDMMWATDATKVYTRRDGWVWVFPVVEHWNGECLAIHVAKHGSRFAALSPLCTALKRRFGKVERGVARGLGLTIRTDNGSQYRSDDFLASLKAWGIAPSFGFIRQPETNGVAERFHRTMKEQAVLGVDFEGIEDVRRGLEAFVRTYNEHWLLKKLGYHSPLAYRRMREEANAA